jgi:hypothetical protein
MLATESMLDARPQCLACGLCNKCTNTAYVPDATSSSRKLHSFSQLQQRSRHQSNVSAHLLRSALSVDRNLPSRRGRMIVYGPRVPCSRSRNCVSVGSCCTDVPHSGVIHQSLLRAHAIQRLHATCAAQARQASFPAATQLRRPQDHRAAVCILRPGRWQQDRMQHACSASRTIMCCKLVW